MEKTIVASLILSVLLAIYIRLMVIKVERENLIKVICVGCHKAELYYTKSPLIMGLIMFLKGWGSPDKNNMICKKCRKSRENEK